MSKPTKRIEIWFVGVLDFVINYYIRPWIKGYLR